MAVESPFADPTTIGDDGAHTEGLTLAVGRNASLTLGTKSLILLDEDFTNRRPTWCCGLSPPRPKSTLVIPLCNILWAEISDLYIDIQYANTTSKTRVQATTLHYFLDRSEETLAKSWVAELLDRAYEGAQRRKKIKVLINPFSGQGNAQKSYLRDIEPIFAAARCKVDVERTTHQGHAVHIAEKLDTSVFEVVACCSGDGVPHEVFNGLGKRSDAAAALSATAVVQLPCGSGNAMSLNCLGTDSTSMAAVAVVKGLRTSLDLTSITQGNRRTLSFLSQAIGIVAEADLGTEHLRWLGSARFTYGFFVRIMRKTVYPCELAVKIDLDAKPTIKEHYRRCMTGPPTANEGEMLPHPDLPRLHYGTVQSALPSSFTSLPASKIGNFYVGNMALMAPGANFFPAALPSDGHLDMTNIDGDIGRAAAIRAFFAVESGKFFDIPTVKYSKISGYRIKPLSTGKGYIAIDGESVPFEEFQAEVHKGLGCTLTRSGKGYEANGVVACTRCGA